MSKQLLITLVGAALALTVLGCRNEGRDQTRSPDGIPPPGESTPPLVEDEDAIGAQDDYTDDARPQSPDEAPLRDDDSPIDPGTPESGDPGANA